MGEHTRALCDKLFGSPCKKFIHFDSDKLSITGLSTDAFSLKIGGFGVGREKLRDASDSADAMDSLIYRLCELARDLDKDSDNWMELFKFQVAVVALLTDLRLCLPLFEKNPESSRKTLERITDDLRDVLANFRRNFTVPRETVAIAMKKAKIEEGEIESYVSDKLKHNGKKKKK